MGKMMESEQEIKDQRKAEVSFMRLPFMEFRGKDCFVCPDSLDLDDQFVVLNVARVVEIKEDRVTVDDRGPIAIHLDCLTDSLKSCQRKA